MCSSAGTLSRALLVVLSLVAAGGRAAPRSAARARTVSPDGRFVAEIRDGASGESLWVGGATRWPAPSPSLVRPRSEITSALAWSPAGDALAFTSCDSAGQAKLVVVLVDGAAAPNTLTWPIPEAARPARAIMWVGPTRVGAGPTPFAPKMMVSWNVD
jgi:hypothetical protein